MLWKIVVVTTLVVIIVISIVLTVFFLNKWFGFLASEKSWASLAINFLTLVTLIITAVFVILYWDETRKMKDQMVKQGQQNTEMLKQTIRQNDIQMQNSKVALMPILEVEVNKTNHQNYKEFVVMLHNRGKGPAKVLFCRINIQPALKPQRASVARGQNPNLKARTFSKKLGTIGSGNSKLLYSGKGIDYEFTEIEITIVDLFRQMHKWSFIGEEHGFQLTEFPSLNEFEDSESQTTNEGTTIDTSGVK